jgi:methionyl aminopeptidase
MMTPIKTEAEIATVRKAGQILARILHELGEFVEAGKSPLDIEYRSQELFAEYGVEPGFLGYQGFPNYCCISVNEDVVHGIPSEKNLKKGDLITIDCGVLMDGLNTDAAISVIVGGEHCGSEQTKRLNQITKKAMNKAISLVKPGVKTGDLGYVIQQTVEKAGFQIIRELTGHGIGENLHEDPTIYNYGEKGRGETLKAGMTICIEPIVSAGQRFISTQPDGWTISTRDGAWGCQWEHMVLVTENGHEVLTQLKV